MRKMPATMRAVPGADPIRPVAAFARTCRLGAAGRTGRGAAPSGRSPSVTHQGKGRRRMNVKRLRLIGLAAGAALALALPAAAGAQASRTVTVNLAALNNFGVS